jgi:Rrf2 family protein
VRLSAKTEYAAIAMLELALCYGSGEPVRIRTIADSHGVPSRFLVQILLQLKGAGLVESTRGASGGYRLIQDPRQITLGRILAIVEGPPQAITGSAELETPVSAVLLDSWKKVADVQRRMLDEVTLADLVEQVRGRTEAMYYI